jgi:hypothetical protein
LLQAIAYIGDRHLVQKTRGLLAVAGDKRHCSTGIDKLDRGDYLLGPQSEFGSNLGNVLLVHQVSFSGIILLGVNR